MAKAKTYKRKFKNDGPLKTMFYKTMPRFLRTRSMVASQAATIAKERQIPYGKLDHACKIMQEALSYLPKSHVFRQTSEKPKPTYLARRKNFLKNLKK